MKIPAKMFSWIIHAGLSMLSPCTEFLSEFSFENLFWFFQFSMAPKSWMIHVKNISEKTPSHFFYMVTHPGLPMLSPCEHIYGRIPSKMFLWIIHAGLSMLSPSPCKEFSWEFSFENLFPFFQFSMVLSPR